MRYHYYTLAIVAALNKCIVDTFGAQVLAPPYERMKVPWDMHLVHVPVLDDDADWMHRVRQPSVSFEVDDVQLEHYAWQYSNSKRHDIALGIAPRAKRLVWSVPEPPEHIRERDAQLRILTGDDEGE